MAFKIFSVASVSTCLTAFYIYASLRGVYNLMHPLASLPQEVLDSYSSKQLVGNYWTLKNAFLYKSWKKGSNKSTPKMGMKVYLSTNPQFTADFIIDEYNQKLKNERELKQRSGQEEDNNEDDNVQRIPRKTNIRHDNILLWEEPSISKSSLSKSFILSKNSNDSSNANSKSFQTAKEWLDAADEKEIAKEGGGGLSAIMSSAGDGIESTSVLLTLYKGIEGGISNIFGTKTEQDAGECKKSDEFAREVVHIPSSSSIWKNLMNNNTVNVRVVITREGRSDQTFQTSLDHLMQDEKSHDLLIDGVDLVKYELPYHIQKAKRYLYKDILYVVQKFLGQVHSTIAPPWDMSVTKPSDTKMYQQAMRMKDRGAGYPYWKPEVAVKLVSETSLYPIDYVGHSHMDVIHVPRGLSGKKPFESGYAYLPGLYVDEMGLTSEKYIPVNSTIDALPLKISFDSGDVTGDDSDNQREDGASSSGNGLSPGRWRLLRHLANNLESQKDFGFEESDIDDVKRLIADTNVTLLGITVVASVLHLLFEFLTFKNDVEFWRGNKDLTGLSVRALFMDFFSQAIILLYLIEKESSLLMTIPAGCGCIIALWKAQRGSGLKFVKAKDSKGKVIFYNKCFRILGIELQATRLRAAASKDSNKMDGDSNTNSKARDLAALSEETDQLATRLLGKYLMLPLTIGYTCHTLINEEHSGWYSWFITSASSAMYGFGFVFMTPQLFLNYKLKSVAHLPWKVLGYRFVNTFIDDLFAFIIRMPTMARISCFRDDVVFIIYLWQRYLYPVDTSRPVEGGGMDAISAAAQTAVVEDEDESSNKKNQ